MVGLLPPSVTGPPLKLAYEYCKVATIKSCRDALLSVISRTDVDTFFAGPSVFGRRWSRKRAWLVRVYIYVCNKLGVCNENNIFATDCV